MHELVSPVAPQNPIIAQVQIDAKGYANNPANYREEQFIVPAGFAVLFRPGTRQNGAKIIRGICNAENLGATREDYFSAGVSYDTHANFKSMAANYPGSNTISIVCSGVVTMVCEENMTMAPGQLVYANLSELKPYANFPGLYAPLCDSFENGPLVGTYISKVGQNACQVLLINGM